MDVNTRTRYDQYDLSVREKVQFFLCGYAAGFFLMMVFYKDLLIAAAGGLACIFFLPLYRGALCRRRRELLETQFRDFLYAVASSVAAGRQLRRALEDAELTLRSIYPQDAPLCTELAAINHAVREERGDEGALLKDLAERSGSEDIRDFVDVYVLCRRLGGDIEEAAGNPDTDSAEAAGRPDHLGDARAGDPWSQCVFSGLSVRALHNHSRQAAHDRGAWRHHSCILYDTETAGYQNMIGGTGR